MRLWLHYLVPEMLRFAIGDLEKVGTFATIEEIRIVLGTSKYAVRRMLQKYEITRRRRRSRKRGCSAYEYDREELKEIFQERLTYLESKSYYA